MVPPLPSCLLYFSVSGLSLMLGSVVRKIPDELVEHYLARSGFHCPDLRLCRLGDKACWKSRRPCHHDQIEREGRRTEEEWEGKEGAIKAKNLSWCHPCCLRHWWLAQNLLQSAVTQSIWKGMI
ncbi:unnamed protein product [Miscanthus lutarioriparius]|uniref:Secreted protein n=1 Tax=Miscanthus lutarioriparius TaxID=422564 RepID=A0A811NIQ2_9POAL|nr:unnamed protein product [Miscanthus lutarioriparius]